MLLHEVLGPSSRECQITDGSSSPPSGSGTSDTSPFGMFR
jgi:hypothetical protein